jgi:hypothetical protein
METMLLGLKILIAASIFFVWVIRYDNIIKEFQEYGLPDWLRDLTGILKMTFSWMLLFGQSNRELTMIGSLGIAFLMACAQTVHWRSNTDWFRRVPSLVLCTLSLVVFYFSIGT